MTDIDGGSRCNLPTQIFGQRFSEHRTLRQKRDLLLLGAFLSIINGREQTIEIALGTLRRPDFQPLAAATHVVCGSEMSFDLGTN
jgi:hypothetical protein